MPIGIFSRLESVGSDFAGTPLESLLSKISDVLPPHTRLLASIPDPIISTAIFVFLNGFILTVALTSIYTAATLLGRLMKPGFPVGNVPDLPAIPGGVGVPAIPLVPFAGGLANFLPGPPPNFPLQAPPGPIGPSAAQRTQSLRRLFQEAARLRDQMDPQQLRAHLMNKIKQENAYKQQQHLLNAYKQPPMRYQRHLLKTRRRYR